MSKKSALLSQSNPDVDVLGRITIDVIRDDGGPWVYAIEDDGGPLEAFTDLSEAVDFVKRTIEDTASLVAQCEQLGKKWRALDVKSEPTTRRHLKLAKG
jgi:hypothetical protein